MVPFTLHQLQTLKAIAEEKNYTKAGGILYRSQPAVSKQMKRLEANLQVALFYRNKNEISLTENGKLFLLYAERILALCEESCRAVADLNEGNRGSLTVGFSPNMADYFLPKLLAHIQKSQFRTSHSQFQIKPITRSGIKILGLIANNDIDIAILTDPYGQRSLTQNQYVKLNLPSIKNLTFKPYILDELALIISTAYPDNDLITRKKKFSKEDLYNLNFLKLDDYTKYNWDTTKFIDYSLRKIGIDPIKLKFTMQFPSIEGIKNAVCSGLGVAFISITAVEKEIQLGMVQTLKVQDLTMIREVTVVTNNRLTEKQSFQFFHKILNKLKKEEKLSRSKKN